MKRIATLFLAVLLLAACQDRGPTAPKAELEIRAAAAATDIVYQVSGSGTVVREDLEGTPRETYGFQAQVDAAGNASGEAEVHFPSDEASFVIEYPVDLTGIVSRAEFDAPVCHWDEDEVEDPSHVIWESRRKLTGVLVEDVAGAWNATMWRYTSVASPGTRVDLVADEGLSITMTVLRNSKFYLSVEPGGWTSDRDWLLLEGDRLLTRSADGDAASFVYTLKKDAWSFSGPDEHDFGSGNEAAVLEVALVR